MRLIDADKLKEECKYHEVAFYLDDDGSLGDMYGDSTIMDLIDKQPTIQENPFTTIRIDKDELQKLVDKAIENVTVEYNWKSIKDELPKETGYYLCTVEWYGSSTREILIKNNHEIPKKVMEVHFLESTKSFQEIDNFSRYKVLAWMNKPRPFECDK